MTYYSLCSPLQTETDWQNWVGMNIRNIAKKYNIEYYVSSSWTRDNPIVLTKIENNNIPSVGMDHVDCNPGMFPEVEQFLKRIKEENPDWK